MPKLVEKESIGSLASKKYLEVRAAAFAECIKKIEAAWVKYEKAIKGLRR